MITPSYVQLMARYNAWQNASLYKAADELTPAERQKDRGAFFRSIEETLNHILWADQIWMSRLAETGAPAAKIIPDSVSQHDWETLKSERIAFDKVIATWADTVPQDQLDGELTWYSGALGAEITRPRALLITHMFNHGTHHRGQVHAMLTASGAKPDDTDIPFMPGL